VGNEAGMPLEFVEKGRKCLVPLSFQSFCTTDVYDRYRLQSRALQRPEIDHPGRISHRQFEQLCPSRFAAVPTNPHLILIPEQFRCRRKLQLHSRFEGQPPKAFR
jgi:hypothetical protein